MYRLLAAMKIAVSPYQLERLVPKGYRQGALLRITFADGCMGYADCHPWEEMADAPLAKQLSLLKEGKTTALTSRALAIARQDAEARSCKRSLVDPRKVPPSHWLTSDLFTWQKEDSQRLKEHGYSHLKFKVGHDVEREISLLKALFPYEGLKLRLDFNERLTKAQFESFLEAIGPLIREVDFIEDPFPFDAMEWENIQNDYDIQLACDRQAPEALGLPNAATVLILKPALHDPTLFNKAAGQRIVVTSYVAHPLDQLVAAYAAAIVDPSRTEKHGLLSHRLYAPTPYSKGLSWQNPSFTMEEEGYGFGFDTLLAKEPWVSL